MTDDDRLHQGLEMIGEAVAEQTEQAKENARIEVRRERPKVMLLSAVVSAVLSMAAASGFVYLYGQQAATNAAVSSLRQQAEESRQQGEQANTELTQQGRVPVEIPEPGTAPDTEVITSAVTARVLASIPEPEISSQRLGAAIAQQLATSPPVVSSTAIAAQVAGYLKLNPPAAGPQGEPGESPPCLDTPSQCEGAPGSPGAAGPEGPAGPQGPQGEPGEPPTQEQVEAAFAVFVQANPELLRGTLCAGIGTWQEVTLRTANGGTASGFLCVTGTTDPIIQIP